MLYNTGEIRNVCALTLLNAAFLTYKYFVLFEKATKNIQRYFGQPEILGKTDCVILGWGERF
jgi:hypothetical protein